VRMENSQPEFGRMGFEITFRSFRIQAKLKNNQNHPRKVVVRQIWENFEEIAMSPSPGRFLLDGLADSLNFFQPTMVVGRFI